MAHKSEINDSDVLAHLAKARKPLSLREVAAALGIRRAGRHALAKMLPRLEKRGEIKRVKGGRFALAEVRPTRSESRQDGPVGVNSEGKKVTMKAAHRAAAPARPHAGAGTIIGRLIAHRDGFGFVVPEKPTPGLDGDLFIPPRSDGRRDARRSRRWRASSGASRGDGGGTRAEGTILRVLGRAHATVVGVFRYGAGGNVVAPYESRIAAGTS